MAQFALRLWSFSLMNSTDTSITLSLYALIYIPFIYPHLHSADLTVYKTQSRSGFVSFHRKLRDSSTNGTQTLM